MRLILTLLPLAAACAEDTRLPPVDRDSDGDGLYDHVENGLGTNPFLVDSDGDTYEDGDEAFFGTDPTDEKDRFYQGRWPYWRDKDSLWDPGFDGLLQAGDRMPRLRALDHHGDRVDLYDFGGPDQDHEYLLIDVCAAWCGPCLSLADWVSGGDDAYGLEQDYAAVRAAVDDGTLAYVTVLTQDFAGGRPDQEMLAAYHEDFRHRRIPILSDLDGEVEDAVVGATGGWPSFVLVRAKTMRLVTDPGYMVPEGLEAALQRLE